MNGRPEVEIYPSASEVARFNGDLEIPLPLTTLEQGKAAPQNDQFFLGALSSNLFKNEDKIKIANFLFDSIFPDTHASWDQQRVGQLLNQALKLQKDPTTPQELKDSLHQRLTPSMLAGLVEISSRQRWEEEATTAVLHAYCEFQTIERLFGKKEAASIYRDLAQKMATARVLDEELETVPEIMRVIGRGNAIYLGARGAEMAQVAAQVALIQTTEEFEADFYIQPYYRDHATVTNLGDESSDPDKKLMTIEQVLDQLARSEEAINGPVDLALFGNINQNGRGRIMKGYANVGLATQIIVGFLKKLRMEQAEKEGVIYEGPQRTDAFGKMRLKKMEKVVLTSLGEGALSQLDTTLDFASLHRLPQIILIQDNKLAIGTKKEEVVSNPEVWRRGQAKDIPGIKMEDTDLDKLYLAVRFAVLRAYYDAGPTLIQAFVRRLVAHSNAHGDTTTEELLEQVKQITGREIKTTQKYNQLDLKRDVEELIYSGEFSEGEENKLWDIYESVVDPVEVTLRSLERRGYITMEEVERWATEARGRIQAIKDRVLKKTVANPKLALEVVRCSPSPLSELIVPDEFKHLNVKNPETVAKAVLIALANNPRIRITGVDAIKGENHQGYWDEVLGTYRAVGHIPGAVENSQIDENTLVARETGFGITPTSENMLRQARRSLAVLGYVDYATQALPALQNATHLYWTTSGKLTTLVNVLTMTGAVDGGGPMHSQEGAAKMFQTHTGVSLYYPSNPERVCGIVLHCLLRETNPTVIMVPKISEREQFTPHLIDPGRAWIIREGKDLQFITYGPLTNIVRKEIGRLESGSDEEKRMAERIGHLDLTSINPFPYEDLGVFLEGGRGPIVIAHEESGGIQQLPNTGEWILGKGFGGYLAGLLASDQQLFRLVRSRLPVKWIGSDVIPDPPADKSWMDQVLLNSGKIRQLIFSLLAQ